MIQKMGWFSRSSISISLRACCRCYEIAFRFEAFRSRGVMYGAVVPWFGFQLLQLLRRQRSSSLAASHTTFDPMCVISAPSCCLVAGSVLGCDDLRMRSKSWDPRDIPRRESGVGSASGMMAAVFGKSGSAAGQRNFRKEADAILMAKAPRTMLGKHQPSAR